MAHSAKYRGPTQRRRWLEVAVAGEEVVTNAELMRAIQRVEGGLAQMRRELTGRDERERDLIERVVRVEERQTAMGRLTVGISAVLSVGAALLGVKR